MPAQKAEGRRFPLIIISIINKSRSQCFKKAGDGPCTIPQIKLIQHAVNDAGRWRERRGGGEREGNGRSSGVRRVGVVGCWAIAEYCVYIGEVYRSRDE